LSARLEYWVGGLVALLLPKYGLAQRSLLLLLLLLLLLIIGIVVLAKHTLCLRGLLLGCCRLPKRVRLRGRVAATEQRRAGPKDRHGDTVQLVLLPGSKWDGRIVGEGTAAGVFVAHAGEL
jgi:hypothetical protein